MSLKGIFALTIGLVLLWVGWNNWKQRDTDAIPLVEDKILAATGEKPLSRTRFDRISRRVQAGLGLALGLFHGFLGFVLIFNLGE